MRQKDIIFIIASALFVILVWIIFEVIHGSATSTISEKLSSQVVPITAEFDLKAIENIKNRNKIEPLYEATASAVAPTLTPSPTASPTPTIQLLEEAASEASEEGELL